MATLISSDRLQKHNIDKYNFKVFAMGTSQEDKNHVVSENLEQNFVTNSIAEDEVIDSSSISSSSKESLIESLMKKTDEMSSNFIKLQMKLENMTQEHKDELLKVKEESFNEGVISGKEKILEAQDENLTNEFAQLSSSILTLEDSAGKYDEALQKIKSELISAALDISKEVIKVELGESSNEIAKLLSDELIEELQGASKITLKVNPKNHGEISRSVGSLQHIEILSDNAINEGGIIAISDVGNIDAQIDKRFQRVKRAALNE